VILSALLLGAAAPDLSISTLVGPTHQHDWVVLDHDEGIWFHWDRNSRKMGKFEGREFPTVLTRFQVVPRRYPSGRQDVVIAIDCQRNMTATVEASQQISEKAYAPGEARWTAEHLEFSEFADEDLSRGETQKMMRAICGEDWTS